MFMVDVQVANICSVLICVSGNGGYADVACLFRDQFFFSLCEMKVSVPDLIVFICQL